MKKGYIGGNLVFIVSIVVILGVIIALFFLGSNRIYLQGTGGSGSGGCTGGGCPNGATIECIPNGEGGPHTPPGDECKIVLPQRMCDLLGLSAGGNVPRTSPTPPASVCNSMGDAQSYIILVHELQHILQKGGGCDPCEKESESYNADISALEGLISSCCGDFGTMPAADCQTLKNNLCADKAKKAFADCVCKSKDTSSPTTGECDTCKNSCEKSGGNGCGDYPVPPGAKPPKPPVPSLCDRLRDPKGNTVGCP
jgi:hypothetical protein